MTAFQIKLQILISSHEAYVSDFIPYHCLLCSLCSNTVFILEFLRNQSNFYFRAFVMGLHCLLGMLFPHNDLVTIIITFKSNLGKWKSFGATAADYNSLHNTLHYCFYIVYHPSLKCELHESMEILSVLL